jgi:cell division septum initiation protein DivIVA
MVQTVPDQSSASTEHALIQEIAAPLAGLPDDPVPEVADVEFPIVLRGYERLAVDAYVRRVSQLVADLNAARAPQAAVRRALERVGGEVAGVLQRAHETAEEITASSRAEAEDRLEAARQEAQAIMADAREQAQATVGGAQHLLTELDAETDRIWAERHQIVEDARGLAAQLLGLAEAAVERFPAADERARAYGHDDDHTDEHDLGSTEEHAIGAHGFEALGPMDHGLDEHEAESREDDTGELPGPSDPHTEPFDVEAEAPLPAEEPTTQRTLPLKRVEPPDDEDDRLSHDAE